MRRSATLHRPQVRAHLMAQLQAARAWLTQTVHTGRRSSTSAASSTGAECAPLLCTMCPPRSSALRGACDVDVVWRRGYSILLGVRG